MTFSEAVAAAKAGAYVRRPGWNDETKMVMRGECPTVLLGNGDRWCLPAPWDRDAKDWMTRKVD